MLLIDPSQYGILKFHSGPLLAAAIKTEHTDLGVLLIGKSGDGRFLKTNASSAASSQISSPMHSNPLLCIPIVLIAIVSLR